jgi:hypothetical protein
MRKTAGISQSGRFCYGAGAGSSLNVKTLAAPSLALMESIMFHRCVALTSLCLFLVPFLVAAAPEKDRPEYKIEGKIIKVDAEKRTITIAVTIPAVVNDEDKISLEAESTHIIPKDAKIVDPLDKDIQDGLKSRKLKPGITIRITGKAKDNDNVARQVQVLERKE